MLTNKRYAYCKDKQMIRKIYQQSFPEAERFPFWILKHCSKNNNVHLDAILCDEKPIGMQFIVNYDDISYLMYFAIDANHRGLNYGSQALRNMVIRNNNVLLCIEKPVDDATIRRKSFYLRNGFYETECYLEDTGVEYEILSSVKNFSVNENILRKRYTEMSNNPIMRYIIKHTFDVENINILR